MEKEIKAPLESDISREPGRKEAFRPIKGKVRGKGTSVSKDRERS